MANPKGLLLLLMLIYQVCGYDYCKLQDKFCKNNKRHIVCHPDQMNAKGIQGGHEVGNEFEILPMTPKLRKVIVDEHNKVRNELACGEAKDKEDIQYPPASHMRELVWDNELEYIALKHAELCIFEHDECRVSSKYDRAGQNLAQRQTDQPQNMTDFVKYFIKAWYDEYKLANVADVLEIKGTPGIGHFTQLSGDRVTRVGCAVSRCKLVKEKDLIKYLYTCDYSFSNMMGLPVYKNSSQPADRCTFVNSVKSKKYKCLCANTDHFWPLW